MQRVASIWSTLSSAQRRGVILALVYLLIAFAIVPFGSPFAFVIALGAAIPVFYLLRLSLRWRREHFIDHRLTRGLHRTETWPVYAKTFPIYKFVDIFRAIATFAEQDPQAQEIRSEHNEPLRGLLNVGRRPNPNRRIKPPPMIARKISYDEELFLPADCFWRVRSAEGVCIIRLRAGGPMQQVQLEIATEHASAQPIMERILRIAAERSIYRNHLLSVAFGPQIRPAFGDSDEPAFFDLVFEKEKPIADRDIVFDDEIRVILDRALVDFHQRRDRLMQAGLPGKRGVLFYGPPGTGKTYTCKYLFQQLKPITAIVATGNSLTQIKAVCSIAKMFQPSLVILEDVDLVFSDRTTNVYSTILGDFMDQLDGFSEHDHVLFILTTNALERVESAIKDRPGRISQCVYFGPPTAELRRRYIQTLTRPYDVSKLHLDQVIAKTNGVSQAFLKELVFRAVQVATGEQPHGNGSPTLLNNHFTVALHEMTVAGGLGGKRIIGFHVEP
jgi:hypothetical protein